MAKFTFKDTGKKIKVGDVFYFYHIEYKNKPSVAIPFVAKDVEYIVKSCKVQDFGIFYKDCGRFLLDRLLLLKTDDISNPTFTVNDCLYSSQEACNDAMEIRKLQEVISQDIFAIHDINIIKKIHNKYFNNNNRKLQTLISQDIFAIHNIDKLKEIHNKYFNNNNL